MSELKFASVFTKAFAFAQHSFLFFCFLLLLKSRVKTTFDIDELN